MKLILDVEEAKSYLRAETDTDDNLIGSIVSASEKLVQDISRLDDAGMHENISKIRIAVLYAVAYLYEHREEADHGKLLLSLRSLLIGERKTGF